MKYSFTFAALVAVSSAHTIFQQITVAGTEYRQYCLKDKT
jgi:hypothetical protein